MRTDTTRTGTPLRSTDGVVDGHLSVLAIPAALAPHAQFAVAAELGVPARIAWSPQHAGATPGGPALLQAAVDLVVHPGTAGRLSASLRRLGDVRFEVWEDASAGCDAVRYQFTPELGLHQAVVGANGDVVVGENRLRALVGAALPGAAGGVQIARALEDLLGDAWDEALEPLRRGGEGAEVTWLRQVV